MKFKIAAATSQFNLRKEYRHRKPMLFLMTMHSFISLY